ncbi:unnamed protein product, partial [Mesorhabditis belari]|uniref:G-protein coupled receptors family 1 profile domain-containing protein n=1 Tax=Mesorhabditis belari TaxID=2138241 RepID=A0AAF3J9W2_9BILA
MNSTSNSFPPIPITPPPPLLPPEPIASDYVEMITLVLMFIIGAPLNLAAYTQLAERPIHTRLDILKRHLNYSDLLVIFVYVPSRACWLLTYDWRGGDLLCKVVKFMHTFAFQSSSNVIVCIAVDRLLSVLSHAHNSPSKAHRRTRAFMSIAWTVAFIVSLPQLAIWRSYVAFKEINWSQCLQIWEIARLELGPTPDKLAYNTLLSYETLYSSLHMGLVFWIPAMTILLCYMVVLWWVWVNSRISLSGSSLRVVRGPSLPTAFDSNDTTLLTRASEWKPLKTFTKNKDAAVNDEKAMPKIIVSDENCGLQTNGDNHQRVSITSTEAYAKAGAHMSSCQSYNARITRSRAIRVSFQLVAAYIICWLPYNLLGVLRFASPKIVGYHSSLYFLHELIVFNSVINPYLYGLFGNLRKPVSRNYD